MSTVFGKIIRGELPCDKVFESENIIAFKDIAPRAPVHILIVPKKEIRCLQEVSLEDLPLVTEMIAVAMQLASQFSIADGYRLITNNGKKGGQVVEHLHFHLVGGKTFSSHTGLE
ncbi:MAG: histidine triad nucleotide-binding protein [Verrucomicrobia bacterium]|nr:histidine triad nucleotide-binding protein [Verrucomicrobiota bacterium]